MIENILDMSQDIFHILLGKYPIGVHFEGMTQLWLIAGKHISGMYDRVITGIQRYIFNLQFKNTR